LIYLDDSSYCNTIKLRIMRTNDPLFTSHEDSFGYGCKKEPSSNQFQQYPSPGCDSKRLRKRTARNTSPMSISRAISGTHDEMRLRRSDQNNTLRSVYNVSPPRCQSEQPRRHLLHYDHRDISPLLDEDTPEYLLRLHARGYGGFSSGENLANLPF
jgi:hypothetical protein